MVRTPPARREAAAADDAPAFKPGDIARLKSGGPMMTVAETPEDGDHAGQVICDWFDVDQHAQTAGFFPAMLHNERGYKP